MVYNDGDGDDESEDNDIEDALSDDADENDDADDDNKDNDDADDIMRILCDREGVSWPTLVSNHNSAWSMQTR